DTTDKVRVDYFFWKDGTSGDAIDAVRFEDGTVWTREDLLAKALTGDAGNNTLQAYSSGSTLTGNEGNDTLKGGAGNDVLIGGKGNDSLHGGAGSDTYVFGRGDGRDTIYNNDAGANKTDVLQFTDGIRPEEIALERSGSSLYLNVKGTTDRINVYSFFLNDGTSGNAIDEVRFEDGTVWTREDLLAKALTGDAGNNTLQAYSSGSTLTGNEGN
ncbi:calcium-binding protein, partial [Kalamiella sp. sgz302252]|uniref:calcium-binding protein n=1 Tax=Pantoea sp. sgz302252 TaxID=3341827 RepID=UPI0036D27097